MTAGALTICANETRRAAESALICARVCAVAKAVAEATAGTAGVGGAFPYMFMFLYYEQVR